MAYHDKALHFCLWKKQTKRWWLWHLKTRHSLVKLLPDTKINSVAILSGWVFVMLKIGRTFCRRSL